MNRKLIIAATITAMWAIGTATQRTGESAPPKQIDSAALKASIDEALRGEFRRSYLVTKTEITQSGTARITTNMYPKPENAAKFRGLCVAASGARIPVAVYYEPTGRLVRACP